MKQIQYKGLTIHYCKAWASVKFGGKVWDFKTLKQAKQFITIIEEAI